MFCMKCGGAMNEGARFCALCGTGVQPSPAITTTSAQRDSTVRHQSAADRPRGLGETLRDPNNARVIAIVVVLCSLTLIAPVVYVGAMFVTGMVRSAVGRAPALSPNAISRPPMSDFRQLQKMQGDAWAGFRCSDGTATIESVTARFGKPVRTTEDGATMFTPQARLLFYEATDDYGNKTEAVLVFWEACKDKRNPQPGCFCLRDVLSTQPSTGR